MKTPRNPATIHAPLAAYSHQIELSGAERTLVMSGQVGMRADGSLPDDPMEQLAVALDNVERNLEEAGMEIGDLVRLMFYLVGEWDSDARRGLVASRLGSHRPSHDGDLGGRARRADAARRDRRPRESRRVGQAAARRSAMRSKKIAQPLPAPSYCSGGIWPRCSKSISVRPSPRSLRTTMTSSQASLSG